MKHICDREYEPVLSFWFGELDGRGEHRVQDLRVWQATGLNRAEERRAELEAIHRATVCGDLEHWSRTAEGCIAQIVVLHQFSRLLFRGTPEMFAHDPRAQACSLHGLENAFDMDLRLQERLFFWQPLVRAEDVGLQGCAIRYLREFHQETEGEDKLLIGAALRKAEQGRELVSRFGRFPRRNLTLGRPSTCRERDFLEELAARAA